MVLQPSLKIILDPPLEKQGNNIPDPSPLKYIRVMASLPHHPRGIAGTSPTLHPLGIYDIPTPSSLENYRVIHSLVSSTIIHIK